MRRKTFIIAAGILAATLGSAAFAGDDPSSAPPISCGNGIPGGVNCLVSKKELKEARYAFHEGVKLQEHQRLEEAFARFDKATRLAPQNMQFLTAREVVKAQLVFDHVQRGNLLLWENCGPRPLRNFVRPSISIRKTSSRGNGWRKPPANWRPQCLARCLCV